MPRRAEGPIPLLELDGKSRVPLHRQLADAVRSAVLHGRLAGGSRIASTRSLAEDLEVSRSTIITAVNQLKAEGYLRGRPGSGTFVPEGLAVGGEVWLAGEDTTVERVGTPGPALAPRPFFPGVPATEEFAAGAFGRLLRTVWREIGPALLAEGPTAGDPELRAAVARHLRGSRRVRCSPEDVVITLGAQEGLSLAFELVVEPGDQVWLENPGYVAARRAIEWAGAAAVAVPVDGDGIQIRDGMRRAPGARAVYLTPSHQFPTGAALSLARRLEVLKWADEGERWIVEDDYDSEFRLEGRPLPSLQGLDEAGRAIYVGTFSKSLAPALRLGFAVFPRALRDRALELKQARTGPASNWQQRVTARFLDEGHFARHVRRTRALYRARRDALVAAVRRHLGGRAAIREPTGAMHAILDLPRAVDPWALAEELSGAEVDVIPLSWFCLPGEQVDPAFVLGFAGYPPGMLEEGVRRIARLL